MSSDFAALIGNAMAREGVLDGYLLTKLETTELREANVGPLVEPADSPTRLTNWDIERPRDPACTVPST